MGRPEKPIDQNGPGAELAGQLRNLRTNAGKPTYRDMAARCGLSTSVLSTAADGTTLPTWKIVAGYVAACGGDLGDWRERWQKLTTPPPAPPATDSWQHARRAARGASLFATDEVVQYRPPGIRDRMFDVSPALQYVRQSRHDRVLGFLRAGPCVQRDPQKLPVLLAEELVGLASVRQFVRKLG